MEVAKNEEEERARTAKPIALFLFLYPWRERPRGGITLYYYYCLAAPTLLPLVLLPLLLLQGELCHDLIFTASTVSTALSKRKSPRRNSRGTPFVLNEEEKVRKSANAAHVSETRKQVRTGIDADLSLKFFVLFYKKSIARRPLTPRRVKAIHLSTQQPSIFLPALRKNHNPLGDCIATQRPATHDEPTDDSSPTPPPPPPRYHQAAAATRRLSR